MTGDDGTGDRILYAAWDGGLVEAVGPLVELEAEPNSRAARKAVLAWLAEHPNASGYVEVEMPRPRGGSWFYKIEGGRVYDSSAIACQPWRFPPRKAKKNGKPA